MDQSSEDLPRFNYLVYYTRFSWSSCSRHDQSALADPQQAKYLCSIIIGVCLCGSSLDLLPLSFQDLQLFAVPCGPTNILTCSLSTDPKSSKSASMAIQPQPLCCLCSMAIQPQPWCCLQNITPRSQPRCCLLNMALQPQHFAVFIHHSSFNSFIIQFIHHSSFKFIHHSNSFIIQIHLSFTLTATRRRLLR